MNVVFKQSNDDDDDDDADETSLLVVAVIFFTFSLSRSNTCINLFIIIEAWVCCGSVSLVEVVQASFVVFVLFASIVFEEEEHDNEELMMI